MSGGDEHDGQAGGDVAPGETRDLRTEFRSYLVGLALAALLTGLSFWIPTTTFVWAPAVPMALIVFAIAQMGIHLVFFLHITTAPDNTNNVLALAFGVLIVFLLIGGSIWIMANLNGNMMPPDTMIRMQR